MLSCREFRMEIYIYRHEILRQACQVTEIKDTSKRNERSKLRYVYRKKRIMRIFSPAAHSFRIRKYTFYVKSQLVHPSSGRLHVAMLDTQIAFANDVLGKTDGLTEWRAIANNRQNNCIMQWIRDLIWRTSPILAAVNIKNRRNRSIFSFNDVNDTSLHLIKSHNFPVYCTSAIIFFCPYHYILYYDCIAMIWYH